MRLIYYYLYHLIIVIHINGFVIFFTISRCKSFKVKIITKNNDRANKMLFI